MPIHLMNLFRRLLLLLPLVAASPAAANTVGDISGDGKIDLTEAVYALRVSAGVYPGLDPSCILTGRNQWAAGAAYRECDVVSHANATFVCLQPHTSTTGANEPPLATHWLRLDLKGDKGEVGPGCWDLNGDQNCDHGREDTNMDGVCDARDCPPWLDVRAFGAVGDGATDSTDAIQAAIDHAASIPTFQRPVVLLPHGNFVVTRTIHVTTASTQIRGSGMRNSHLIFAPPAADSGNAGLHLAPSPVASYLENVQLSDFTVIGGNGNAKTLIKIEGLNESRIERIQLNSHDAGDLGTIGLHVTGWDTTQISDLATIAPARS
ncbi:MAG: glycosyl hydrolase family 28-related protein [Thermodesulfobacteriota bacterium]